MSRSFRSADQRLGVPAKFIVRYSKMRPVESVARTRSKYRRVYNYVHTRRRDNARKYPVNYILDKSQLTNHGY